MKVDTEAVLAMMTAQHMQQALDDGAVLLFVSLFDDGVNCDCIARKEDGEYAAENYDPVFQRWFPVTLTGIEQFIEIVERGTHSYVEI